LPWTLVTLKTRAEFQRVRGGGRATNDAFILEGKRRPAAPAGTVGVAGPRFGFTITKKIGNAVVRNRIRRRLRAALSEVAPGRADPETDYVIVARIAAATRPFAGLAADLAAAITRVGTAQKQRRKP
jgi:ribonuclease P protein component